VAKRTLVLSAVTVRAYLENEGAEDTVDYHERMLAWIGRHSIWSEFEPPERSFVEALIGKLGKRRAIDGIWRSEGLGVLAWSLGYGNLPAFAEEVDQQQTAKRLGFMRDPAVLDRPKLVGLAERRRYARLARAIHWRLREVRARKRHIDLERVARTLPFVAPLLEGKTPLIEGDLRLGHRALHRASREDVQHALSIAAERHIAANWLVGAAARYSAVDTPT
jgi:hypothetical protein